MKRPLGIKESASDIISESTVVAPTRLARLGYMPEFAVAGCDDSASQCRSVEVPALGKITRRSSEDDLLLRPERREHVRVEADRAGEWLLAFSDT